MNPKLIIGIPAITLFVVAVTLFRADPQVTMDLYQKPQPATPERLLKRDIQGRIANPLDKYVVDEVWKAFPKCPTHNLDTNGHYALTLVDSKGVEFLVCYKDYQDAQFLLLKIAGLKMVRKEGK